MGSPVRSYWKYYCKNHVRIFFAEVPGSSVFSCFIFAVGLVCGVDVLGTFCSVSAGDSVLILLLTESVDEVLLGVVF